MWIFTGISETVKGQRADGIREKKDRMHLLPTTQAWPSSVSEAHEQPADAGERNTPLELGNSRAHTRAREGYKSDHTFLGDKKEVAHDTGPGPDSSKGSWETEFTEVAFVHR